MGRILHFGEEELTLKLTGIPSYLSLTRKVIMPYRIIKNVYVDYFQAHVIMLRMPGTSIPPLDMYEGSFEYGNEWYFLSYERVQPLIFIELEGHKKFRYVIFQMEKPTSVAAEIRRRVTNFAV
ncbi:hypothetical protein [Niallia endozanthoxylica]|uniref:Uncharacterized protein n=1 Tax=Niallia endozanthoxylica TaxID=2036016 RepID=A0A5J5HQP8_9BACI|nr:hypothetical protein [Niallia endozanthoxylica]KAA9021767.1 hypothetical protein F4V44_17490 [Niallia endozanthoxylica]